MERRFDMGDFEQSLKGHADQFRLTPSRRVWKGIYNDLHPGSKWPSITVAAIFIITLVTIGNLNNSPRPAEKNEAVELDKSITATPNTNSENESLVTNSEKLIIADYLFSHEKSYNALSLTKNLSENLKEQEKNINEFDEVGGTPVSKRNNTLLTTAPVSAAMNKADLTYNPNKMLVPGNLSMKKYNTLISDKNSSSLVFPKKEDQSNDNNNTTISLDKEYFTILNGLNTSASEHEYSIVRFEHSRLSLINNESVLLNTGILAGTGILKESKQNKLVSSLAAKRKNKKVKWIYYLTPSVSSASFRDKGMTFNFVSLQNRAFHGMTYNADWGMDAGAQMNYRLSEKWNFITGANIRYSGYNIVSNLVHPTFTTLKLRDNSGLDYSKTYITHYGNGITQNQISLLNYSLQASIPVGLQYNIWQNKNIQLNLASTIDVSTVLKSNAYIISSDDRFYVKDPLLSRRVNMGINFNPNIVISGQKVKWHVGPNIHYQLFSTYQDSYLIKEHLVDYGIRIGISK
ncbi:MAG: hypothetical protein ABI208_08600 [Ginsengibacter sp.]